LEYWEKQRSKGERIKVSNILRRNNADL